MPLKNSAALPGSGVEDRGSLPPALAKGRPSPKVTSTLHAVADVERGEGLAGAEVDRRVGVHGGRAVGEGAVHIGDAVAGRQRVIILCAGERQRAGAGFGQGQNRRAAPADCAIEFDVSIA